MPHSTPLILSLHPDTEEVIRLTARVNLYEYLQAYGVRILQQGDKKELDNRYMEARRLLFEISNYKRIPEKITQAADPDYKKADKGFYLGQWFEIYCARFVRDHFNLKDDQYAYQVLLTRDPENTPNQYTEYDLMYVRNNKLYIAECKFFHNKINFQKSRILKEWYKLAGLKLYMGLNATPFILTANFTTPNARNDIEKALQLFNIRDYGDIHTVAYDKLFKAFLEHL